MMSSRLIIRSLAAAAVTVLVGSSAADAAVTHPRPRLAVTGYAESGTPSRQVAASARALTTLGVDGVNINAAGSAVSMPDNQALLLLKQARREHLRAEILVGNFSEALGDFDPAATDKLVSSRANRAAVITTVLRAVREQGWDGVQIDFEAIKAKDRAPLITFLAELRAALPARKSLSMAVTAFTVEREYADNGYDLDALGRVLDRVVLMAYDEHGPTWNGVGPIGGLPWQGQALRLVLKHIRAAKLDLGVAGYGYTWPTTGTGEQVSDAQARQLVTADSATARWDARQGEWTVTLHNGTVMWWSDARSWPLRAELAARYHLHGMALWSLRLSDPLSHHH